MTTFRRLNPTPKQPKQKTTFKAIVQFDSDGQPSGILHREGYPEDYREVIHIGQHTPKNDLADGLKPCDVFICLTNDSFGILFGKAGDEFKD